MPVKPELALHGGGSQVSDLFGCWPVACSSMPPPFHVQLTRLSAVIELDAKSPENQDQCHTDADRPYNGSQGKVGCDEVSSPVNLSQSSPAGIASQPSSLSHASLGGAPSDGAKENRLARRAYLVLNLQC